MSLLLLFRSAGGGTTYDETGRQVGPIVLTPTTQVLAVFGEVIKVGGWSVSDDFDRADSNSLGPNWSEEETDPDFFSIVGNKLEIGDTGARGIAKWVGPGAAEIGNDQYSKGFLEGRVDPHGGLAVRLSGTLSALNGYSLEVSWSIVSQDMTMTLRRYDNSDLAASPGPTAAFYNRANVSSFPAAEYRVEAKDNVVRCYEGAALRITYIDPAPHSGGSVGFAAAFGSGGTLVGPYTYWEGGSLQGIRILTPTVQDRGVFSERSAATVTIVPVERDLAVFRDSPQGGVIIILPTESDTLIGGSPVFDETGRLVTAHIDVSVLNQLIALDKPAVGATLIPSAGSSLTFTETGQAGMVIVLPQATEQFTAVDVVTAIEQIIASAVSQLLAVERPAGQSFEITTPGGSIQVSKEKVAPGVVVVTSALMQYITNEFPTAVSVLTPTVKDIANLIDGQRETVVILPSAVDALTSPLNNEFVTVVLVIVPGVGDVLFPIRFTAGGTRSVFADRLADSVQSPTDQDHEVTDRRRGHAAPDSHRHTVSSRPRRSQRH